MFAKASLLVSTCKRIVELETGFGLVNIKKFRESLK